MGRQRRRGRPRGAKKRRQRALEAQSTLSTILAAPAEHDVRVVEAASRQMWKIGRRHRVGLPAALRPWICRGCQHPLRPGVSARVRVREGRRITTCLNCGRIARRGPDFPREASR